MNEVKKTAPVRAWVELLALAAILLLAACVCALHEKNAVSTRGTLTVSAHAVTDGEAENLVPILEDPWADRGIIHIRGALLRMEQEVGAVNVRVALIPERVIEEQGALALDGAILLNTQMERRPDMKQAHGVDDHCGFHAAVRRSDLEGAGWQFRVMLADTAQGQTRLIETNLVIAAIDGGLAYIRRNPPEEDANE